MSKRKLTRRQAWRIEKIQQQRVARAIRRETETELEDQNLGPEQSGLVIAHYGTQINIEASDGSLRRCHFRTNLGSIVTGDKVIWRDAEPTGIIVAVLERESELSRPDPYGELKTIAANIDRILIVIAPIPKPHSQQIDRYLVAAETTGIQPSLIINKNDLIDTGNRVGIDKLVSIYCQLGYEVIMTSSRDKEMLETLTRFLIGHTSIFVGQSGVGKSSLINGLIPDLNQQVSALSAGNQEGTHTTTTAQLFHFPQGGRLIDSPGVHEFGLWHLSEEQILAGFIEFRPFIGRCKFRNCRHRQEPGCAILQAVKEGHISELRIKSYTALRDSLKAV